MDWGGYTQYIKHTNTMKTHKKHAVAGICMRKSIERNVRTPAVCWDDDLDDVVGG